MDTFLRLPARPHPAVAILRRTLDRALKNRISESAAGITFFTLLAMFPAIASVVALFGMFADRADIAQVIHATAQFVPGGAVTVLNAELHRLIVERPEKLNFAFFGGLVIALWGTSGGVRALVGGLDIAFETHDARSFLRMILDGLLFAASAIVLTTGMLFLAVILPVLARRLPLRDEVHAGLELMRLPLMYVFCTALIGAIYRFAPSRSPDRRHWISWGSVAVSILWILGTLLFAWYVQMFGSYDRVYGNLGAAVGFLTWIWLLLMILLMGAELDGEIERARLTASTVAPTAFPPPASRGQPKGPGPFEDAARHRS
jgi:membrane protein